MILRTVRAPFWALVLLLAFCTGCLAATGEEAPKEGILLVAFGTSVPEARIAFDRIEAVYRRAFPNTPVVWAYTSQIIRRKLAREGIHIGSIGDGLDHLAAEGVKVVRVQSLHVMAGEEFAGLARSVLVNAQKHPGRFEAIYLGRPLLESRRDALATADAVLAGFNGKRKKGEAIVLMGHGQEQGRAGLVFEGVRAAFMEKDPLVFMATVEGERNFDELLQELEAQKIKKVWLAPFMVVAGDHARNDLAGETDSWAARLKEKGYIVETGLHGLGEISEIGQIFARHTSESMDDLTKEPRKP